jgi:hypothetical protein
MSDHNKVVQITDYKVDITHQIVNLSLVLDTPYFSEINHYYSNFKKEGEPVKQYLTLNGLLERLNSIKQKTDKDNSIAILKGLYKDGTSGVYCYKGAPFLFFDIDVKNKPTKKENVHLIDAYNNSEVFIKLQSIAITVWRSNSGNGIAGVLYVPQLTEIKNYETKKHREIGKELCNYIKTSLNVNADFDNAQNKYRQVRYLAKQNHKRLINEKPYAFSYDLTEKVKTSHTGIKQYRYNDNRAISGSIEYQFNVENNIHAALLDNGFTQKSTDRYHHPSTSSSSTGVTKDNVFFNHSNSFSNYRVFTPFWLYLTISYEGNYKGFLGALRARGYEIEQPQKKDFEDAKTKLLTKGEDREKQIFDACYHLQNASYKVKIEFIDNNAKNETEKSLFFEYLKIKPLAIKYDETFFIKSFVSEQIKKVLDYADKYKKVILTAETGTGKTTGIIKHFQQNKTTKRVLILMPLTVIVEQIKSEHPNIVSLTGSSEPNEHIKAKTFPIVIGTYEQGYKHLSDPNTFDYVVIDEIHNLITANSYKRDIIRNLTSILSPYIVIGLTGTTNLLFKSIGYKLVNLIKEALKRVEVNFIPDNRKPLQIALQHLQNVNGKCIMRINSRSDADSLKTELVKLKKYWGNEILILNSDTHIKEGKDFRTLTSQRCFKDNIRLIITTSVIDEGLSIRQKGFTDAVFIETDYKPMPEALKQFFARFRNEDINRKNYYYYRQTNNQSLRSWDPYYDFSKTKKNLIIDAKRFNVTESDKKDIANTKYLYYPDKSVNEYALAYDISKKYFGMMTKQEYIEFLEINYNLKIIEDETHIHTKYDVSESKEQKEKNNSLIASNWLNNNDEVLSALHFISDNWELKKSMDIIGIPADDDIYNLVSANLKVFEDLHKNSVHLEKLGVIDADSILIDKVKAKPVDKRTVNRKIKLYQNIDTIENPKTITDKKNKAKLELFIIEAKKLKTLNEKTVNVAWNKQRCNSKKPSYYNLIDLLNHYSK